MTTPAWVMERAPYVARQQPWRADAAARNNGFAESNAPLFDNADGHDGHPCGAQRYRGCRASLPHADEPGVKDAPKTRPVLRPSTDSTCGVEPGDRLSHGAFPWHFAVPLRVVPRKVGNVCAQRPQEYLRRIQDVATNVRFAVRPGPLIYGTSMGRGAAQIADGLPQLRNRQ